MKRAMAICVAVFIITANNGWSGSDGQKSLERTEWCRVVFRLVALEWEEGPEAAGTIPDTTVAMTYTWALRALPNGSGEEGGHRYVRYLGVIRDATVAVEQSDRAEPNEVDRAYWAQLEAAIGAGTATAMVDVDTRGRARVVEQEDGGAVARNAATKLAALAPLLWPPLAEEGVPLEASGEWSVECRDHIWYTPARAASSRCEHLRVWTDGRVETEITSHYEQVSEGVGVTTRFDGQWELVGSPVTVRAATTIEESFGEGYFTRTEKTAEILSGGIPVRPVESLSEEEEKPPTPE